MKTFTLVLFVLSISFTFSQTLQWEQLSGPHGGSIYSIVSDNLGNIYVSTMWGQGPFKSTDNGESWFSIRNGLTPYSGEFHPMNINSNGDLFIAGAHTTAMICKSTDQGNTWIPLNNLNTNGGSVICISIDDSNNIFVGTGTGIYKSTNNGEDWSALPQFGPGQVDAIAFSNNDEILNETIELLSKKTVEQIKNLTNLNVLWDPITLVKLEEQNKLLGEIHKPDDNTLTELRAKSLKEIEKVYFINPYLNKKLRQLISVHVIRLKGRLSKELYKDINIKNYLQELNEPVPEETPLGDKSFNLGNIPDRTDKNKV